MGEKSVCEWKFVNIHNYSSLNMRSIRSNKVKEELRRDPLHLGWRTVLAPESNL